MKNRPSYRSKPELKPDKNAADSTADGLPPSSRRKLEAIGRDIAGLRRELDRLAAARARERTGKASRRSS